MLIIFIHVQILLTLKSLHTIFDEVDRVDVSYLYIVLQNRSHIEFKIPLSVR